jgi:hypothetical protein
MLEETLVLDRDDRASDARIGVHANDPAAVVLQAMGDSCSRVSDPGQRAIERARGSGRYGDHAERCDQR